MKFLEIQDFEAINKALVFDADDCRVLGRCELYTTKAAGKDKKLYKTIDKSLETRYQEDLALERSLESGVSMMQQMSPFGPLDHPSSRKTFAYIVATLNASHPDYDFTNLQPEDFRKERSLAMTLNVLNMTLLNLSRQQFSICGLWEVIDKHIELSQCDIYVYQPDSDSNPLGEEGLIWSTCYFFFNRTMKRVLYINLSKVSFQRSRHMDDEIEDDDTLSTDKGCIYSEFEQDIAKKMDI
ncbi:hypothetical protein T552_01352 [Pneumocystis carinii B80]|uniref:Repressor of RNA polymerase III transcription MAF1 n=1 Tax=Pneumocystis carinii (strain B80) TaxID=1408658 RepID=A0A0W4ZLY7_PNEC8|nr:hypothetical protein T552_01352 [Pneumocystis carinii B80]KTW29399.1 hypothetical protein T552_01352 [Pneumocystis carinii B80]